MKSRMAATWGCSGPRAFSPISRARLSSLSGSAPQSPRLIQKAAVDALQCDLLDTFRGKEEPPEGGAEP